MLLPWPSAEQAVSQVDTGDEIVTAEPADLVIMNPPFTRDSLRHDQFSKADEKRIKDREKELFASTPVHLSNNGGPFLYLGDFLNRDDVGAVAVVLPLVGATNYATMVPMRRPVLAANFHVETIVTSHDPERIYFSENTDIGEMLVMCRRWPADQDSKPPTRVVNLARNPATPAEAMSLAWAIADGTAESQGYGTVQEWPADRIADGDWGAVQFLSPYLCDRFAALRRGDRLALSRRWAQIADVGPRRTTDTGCVHPLGSMPDADGRYGAVAARHRRSRRRWPLEPGYPHHCQAAQSAHLAEKYWQQRGTLMLPTKDASQHCSDTSASG